MSTRASGVAAPARGRAATFHPLRVSRVERLTSDAVAVSFDVPGDLAEQYAFDAGQSLTLRRTVDGSEHRRSYSICSPPGAGLRIGVREIPDGLFSSWLVHEIAVGDVVEVAAPSGAMRADATEGARHLCIAVGSGITPLLSIASAVLSHPDARVSLLYGNRTSATVMFAEEVADLKNAHPDRVDLVHVLSREPREVELFSGRLEGDRLRTILTACVPLAAVDHVWLCGPVAMVEDARAALAALGVAPERIHVELFHVDAPPPELHRSSAAVQGERTALTVVLDGRSTTTATPRTTTLLDAARSTRPDVPFACTGGVCGTCRALVREGEVEMVRNYALEDDEVSAGVVLTCQTFPLSEAVRVDFDA